MTNGDLPGIKPLTVYRLGGELLVYRCVLANDPDDPAFLESFKSNYERGSRPRKIEEDFTPAHMGLSVWLTRHNADEIGRLYPDTAGEFTVELRLVPGQGFAFARASHPRHLTLWGRAPQLAAFAADIRPV